MKKSNILIISLIAILIIGGLYIKDLFPNKIAAQDKVESGTEIGQKAPDFTLQNLSDKKVSLNNFKGKKILLNFWTSWCRYCQTEMPDIQKLHQNYEKVVIIGVNVGETKGKVTSYMLSNQLNFKVLLDKKKKITNQYLVRGLPTTYIINKKGIIKDKKIGPLDYKQMQKLLELN